MFRPCRSGRLVILSTAKDLSRRARFFAALRMTVCGPLALPLLAVVAALGLQIAGLRMPVVGRGWARFDPACCPMDVLPQLEQINDSAPEGARIFNDLSFGGFLIYEAPRLRVFVDDRCSLYGSEFLDAYEHARRKDPSQLDRWQREYGFQYVLVKTGEPFDGYLAESAAWTALSRTPTAALYRRTTQDGNIDRNWPNR
jgi:hypothetical protein